MCCVAATGFCAYPAIAAVVDVAATGFCVYSAIAAIYFYYVGELWELDGRRVGPINHGKTHQDTFLTDVAKVTKDFIARWDEQTAVCICAASIVAISHSWCPGETVTGRSTGYAMGMLHLYCKPHHMLQDCIS